MNSLLMDGESVRGTLAEQKWQTRRLVKPQPPEDTVRIMVGEAVRNGTWAIAYDDAGHGLPWNARCPYTVGQVLYVRETWGVRAYGTDAPALMTTQSDGLRLYLEYKADDDWGAGIRRTYVPDDPDYARIRALVKCHEDETRWRSSRFMPAWAARLFVRITRIRAERVQDISMSDILAEGRRGDSADLRPWFRDRWNGLHAKFKRAKRNPWMGTPEECLVSYPWGSGTGATNPVNGRILYTIGNPWVWAYDFGRAEKGED